MHGLSKRMLTKSRLPYKIGYDLAGTVVAVGSQVSGLKIGDEVFCCLPFKDGGLSQFLGFHVRGLTR